MSNAYKTVSQVSPLIFRSYDIRGMVEEFLTPDVIYTIGIAIGSEALTRQQTQIILGRDGRLSSPELSAALCAGLLNSGVDVIDIGAVPTPVLYFATHILGINSGVMLTGSHNPPNYNGIKIVLNKQSLKGNEIQTLYQRIIMQRLNYGMGNCTQQNIIENYINYIGNNIKLARPLKIAIDCSNGITGKVAPALFKKLGCEVIELFCEVDGNFPNHSPDTSHAENLQTLINIVKKYQADIGLAFDGDGDRLGAVTNSGEIIWPDRQMMLFAVDILTRNPGAEIIYDIKCTRDLATVIQQHGGKPFMWKTGHSYIKTKLNENQALLAGEMSGHIFFKERWFGFDDGLYAGARLLEILSKDHHSADIIFQNFPNSINTPELKLPMNEERKFIFIENFIAQAKFPEAEITTIDGIRVDFKNGWGLLRPSNTSPYLIFRFEAATQDELQRIQNLFKEQLLAFDPSLNLPF